MTVQSVSKPRKVYKSPSVTSLGAVESNTAGDGHNDKDGDIGYRPGVISRDVSDAEVVIPPRAASRRSTR
jgi:hypothetical protein